MSRSDHPLSIYESATTRNFPVEKGLFYYGNLDGKENIELIY